MIMEQWRGVVNKAPCPSEEHGDVVSMAKTVCTDHVLVLETPNVMARAMADQDGCRVVSVAGRHAVAYASLLINKGSLYTSSVNKM